MTNTLQKGIAELFYHHAADFSQFRRVEEQAMARCFAAIEQCDVVLVTVNNDGRKNLQPSSRRASLFDESVINVFVFLVFYTAGIGAP